MTTQNITIGLGLGDRRHHMCVLDAAGEILAQEGILNTRDVLSAFVPVMSAGPQFTDCGRQIRVSF